MSEIQNPTMYLEEFDIKRTRDLLEGARTNGAGTDIPDGTGSTPQVFQLNWVSSGDYDEDKGSYIDPIVGASGDNQLAFTMHEKDSYGDLYTGDNHKYRFKVSGACTINITTGTVSTNTTPTSADESATVVVTPASGVIAYNLDYTTDEVVKFEIFRESKNGPTEWQLALQTRYVQFLV